MERLGYYNGECGPLEELKVPFLDRVCFYGDGVYDATIALDGVVLYADEHIARFFNSCAEMRLSPGVTHDELAALLDELVAKVDSNEVFVYWQVTRGTALRNHAFPEGPANLWVMITPNPREDLSWDARLVTVEDTRFYHCNAKTLNLLPNVLAAQRAAEADCYEAVFVRDGFVTECAHSNVHILKGGVLITHPTDNLILPGIARAHLVGMARTLGVSVEERPFTAAELMDADEVIVSSSSTYARGVSQIDGEPVGGKDRALLRRLQDALTDEAEGYVAAARA